MRLNGQVITHNPVSNSNLTHCPYVTVPGKIGGMCVSMEHLLWFQAQMANFDSYLEIGTFDGIALSLYAETYPGKQFTAIDSFEVGYATGNGHYEYFFENCKNLDNVNLYRARSCDVLPYIKETFGMIFIDGDHSFESILTDYRLAWRLLEKGGMLVFHDIDLDDTLRVLSIVEAEQNVAIHTTDVGVVYVRKP